ncbi:MAG: LacI family transcriptional regulator [Gemmatimonadota bacterium]|nr:LacI family transcriptional regulator [Gemmatimonadota bacterium]
MPPVRSIPRTRNSTIRDVAKRAGVSVATVSRVLNDSGPVSDETRLRILLASDELRFRPNGAARSLITSRTATFGVLLPDLYGEFFSEVIRGIDQTAQRHQYHVMLSSSHSDKDAIEAALRAMHGRVDGLIIMSPDIDAAALEANFPASLPVVLLNCAVRGRTHDTINIDNVGGARAMTRHLLSLGHRRIAFIRGAERNHDADERLKGYRAALREASVVTQPDLETPGDFTESGGHAAVAALLDRKPRPTAIFAANDSMAIGALSALRDAGVDVPGEMAVAGFDDIPIARYTNPPLSSVHVPINKLGEQAMEMLLDAVTHENTHVRRRERMATTLQVRQSCGSDLAGGGRRVARRAPR